MQNSIIFFVTKCEPFGVKKSMRSFWSLFICNHTPQNMKFSIKGFFNKYDQIRSFLRICSHLLKKILMENFLSVKCQLNYHHLQKYFYNWNITLNYCFTVKSVLGIAFIWKCRRYIWNKVFKSRLSKFLNAVFYKIYLVQS